MSQEKIWDYFQGEGVENFAGAVPRLNFLFRKALKVCGTGDRRVLNVGVGDGWLERRCIGQGWETHSLDPSEAAIRKLDDTGVHAKTGYIDALPYDDDTFDIVFCSEVLEHLSDAQGASGLREIGRTLKAGGFLIGTVPFNETLSESTVVCPDCGNVFHRWGHMRSFDKQKLRSELVEAKFRVVSLATYAFADPSKHAGARTARQWLRWCLGRMGSAQVYANLFFMAQRRGVTSVRNAG